MSVRSFFVRYGVSAALVAVFGWGGSAFAADVTPAPAAPGIVGAAPVSVGAAGCASCQSGKNGFLKGHCNACGKLLGSNLHKDKKAPYPVTLCPGACFGYFQTQWRKWDEVCPYPYLGIGVSDAPKTPGAASRPGTGELAPPRPLDPKMNDPMKVGNGPQIPIPVVPNKFAP
jgi:hypothetical protein